MPTRLAVLFLLAVLVAAAAPAADTVYPCRWVYVHRNLREDRDVDEIATIVATAAEHGLNGMVLAAGLDHLDRQPPDSLQRLAKVEEICARHKVEIIPIVFSIGYGSTFLSEDRNLAEGFLVSDQRMVVAGREAHLQSEAPVEVVNGGFEQHENNRLKPCTMQDAPGKISFVDTQVFHEGKAALRLESFGQDPHGHGRVAFDVPVRPHHCYRVSCWVKTEELAPAGAFRVQVYAGNRPLAPHDARLPATTDWRPVTMAFNSLDFDQIRIYAGVWGGKSGRVWIDDLRIEEVALVNLLRRPGTPVLVRDEATGRAYREGQDFIPLEDPELNFRFDHDGPPLRLLPGGHIHDGQALRVSYYHGLAVHEHQVSACMSEPKVYQIIAREARAIQQRLHPRRWLLSMDEIREGGSCAACRARRLTMAQILGDCITRQFQIIRGLDPQAEVFIWSDMLDPHHNAHAGYYLVDGDYTGSWNYVPKELRIVCWYNKMRKESLAHFSGLGFATLAGAYYDADSLDSSRQWLEALEQTPQAVGIMYTTWRNKYELLAPFGDLVTRREKK